MSNTTADANLTASEERATHCAPLAVGQPLLAPILQETGDANSVGEAGVTGTTVRLRWMQPDCDPVALYRIRLREAGGGWLIAYEGHPGGGISLQDKLRIALTSSDGAGGEWANGQSTVPTYITSDSYGMSYGDAAGGEMATDGMEGGGMEVGGMEGGGMEGSEKGGGGIEGGGMEGGGLGSLLEMAKGSGRLLSVSLDPTASSEGFSSPSTPAAATVELLPSGALYFEVVDVGEYPSGVAPTASLSTSTLTYPNSTVLPPVGVALYELGVDALSVGCQVSLL